MDEPEKEFPKSYAEKKPVERRKSGDEKEVERVRHPLTVNVDRIEIEPKTDNGVVRMAYDLMIYEYDMRKLYEALKISLENTVVVPMRVRVIGRLES